MEPLKWKSPEYEYKPKNNEWFWYIGCGSLAIIILAIATSNFLLGVFSLVAGCAIVLIGIKKPRIINFSIEPAGLRVSSRFYPFEELEYFWINRNEELGRNELIIEQKKKLATPIKIPLPDMETGPLRDFLLTTLKEKKYEQSLTETIAEKLGF